MAGLRFDKVTKLYGKDVVGIKDVSFEAVDGSFLVLVGPSGCGKSTTLRLIAGLERVTSGRIYIGDKLVNDLTPRQRDIAMVFQNYALYPHMTVYENMAFGLRMRKYSRDEIDRRVKEAAKILQMESLLGRYPRALSGGQRQRVAVGRSIVREPKLFLFDEPLSNLDAKLREEMRAELLRLHTRLNATIVYVTHDQIEAMTMGTQIVVLNEGRVQQIADPLTLYNRPANLFVAGFIGSPTMNFIQGRIEKGDFICEEFVLKGVASSSISSSSVTLGVRPEDVKLRRDEGIARAEIEIIETLGSELYLYVKVGTGSTLVVKSPATTGFTRGESIAVELMREKLHFFDGETGERIL